MRRGANEILVFLFTNANLTYQTFYVAKRYIHVIEEGEEDRLFVLAEYVVPTASAGVIVHLVVGGNNFTDDTESNSAPNLLLGRTSNLRLEYMAEICRQGITINYYNNTAPENVPRQGETFGGTGNWRREGICCPCKVGNLQNSFTSIRHYSHDAFLRMSLF